jgi:cation:H+ antiporter
VVGLTVVSEMVIGLTLVAVGTSLPEAATSLMATFRGQNDLAIGNVVGSNLFNILGIAGLTAVIKPLTAPSELWSGLVVMLAFTALAYALVWHRPHRVERWQGVLLFLLYVGYIIFLFMRG